MPPKNSKKPSDLFTNKKRTDLHCLFIIKLNKNLCKTKPFQSTHYLKKNADFINTYHTYVTEGEHYMRDVSHSAREKSNLGTRMTSGSLSKVSTPVSIE